MQIVNPKRENESTEVKPYWYNYYAGFSHTFTQRILETAELDSASIVLDPWNGAGTTTLMASVNGFQSVGVDLNPVMRVIAGSKQAIRSDIEKINRALDQLTAKRKVKISPVDNLGVWFDGDAIEAIRKVENCILEFKHFKSTLDKVDSLTNAQCLLYTALFNCVRSFLNVFIPSNPTWIKKPAMDNQKISLSWACIKKKFIENVKDMVSGISVVDHEWPNDLCSLKVGSSTRLPVQNSSIDFILTSPPYCTRIDYGVATMPELSILCVGGEGEVDRIRRELMGTTTVPKMLGKGVQHLVGGCGKFLDSVKSHSSKASETYYYKNLTQYFLSLDASISEIERVMKPESKFICVAQDSFYKDIHCDLPSIISEMADSKGINLREKIEFESKRNMANLNVKSKTYRKKSIAFETVLIFTKGERGGK